MWPGRQGQPLPHRAIAMMRAIAAGRAQLSCSCEPDLRVDELSCCDQLMVRYLVHAGLIQAADRGSSPMQWVPAQLTSAGYHTLALSDCKAA